MCARHTDVRREQDGVVPFTQGQSMKTIIAGSRGITSHREVQAAIRASHFEITEVVSGKARGVDTIGEEWAEWKKIRVALFPARWRDRDGVFDRSAGFKRNEQMALYADALIAVWDGESSGTADMIEREEKHGLKVFVRVVE